MRRRRRRLWIGVLGMVLIGSATFAWWLCQRGPRDIDPWAWRDIDLGMSLAEVEAMLGRPPGDHDGQEAGEYIAWIWQSDARPAPPGVARPPVELRHIFKTLETDRPREAVVDAWVELHGDRIVIWTGPQFAIAVQLDADDRVVATCVAALRGEDMNDAGMVPGWRRLLDWLGIP